MHPAALGDPWHTPSTGQSGRFSEAVVDDDDEALARKLQQELDDEEMAKRLSQVEASGVNRASRSNNVQSIRTANGDVLPVFKGAPVTDEEMARRLEQELHDERLAHQLTMQESQQQRALAAAPANRSNARKVCSCVASTVIVAAVVVAVLLVFSGGSGLNLIGLNPNFAQNDPYYGRNDSRVIPWDNGHGGHGGLSLEVVNSLDTKWYTQFAKAVSQWDNGNPDALTLKTSEASPDSTCEHIMNKLKVCNGNYGDTQWLGINEQLVRQGYMIASAAKMNDFYLDNAAEAQKQYTMCHEIGHGFGLPHTDENFYNQDLGNCLDYTSHPWVNQQPAAMNFELLNKTYGTVGTRRELAHQVVRRVHPEWVLPTFSTALRRLQEEGHEKAEELGWTVVHRSSFGEIHRRHLGDDYMAHVHIMFATNQI